MADPVGPFGAGAAGLHDMALQLAGEQQGNARLAVCDIYPAGAGLRRHELLEIL